MLADTTTFLTIGTAIVVIAGGAAAWWVAARRRRDVWRRFARRHGLRTFDTGTVPRVEGTIDGRPFSLRAASGGSDSEELGLVEVEMSLGLHGSLPPGLAIEDATGVIGEAQRVLEDGTVATGDAEFDHSAAVRCDDPAAARAYLNESRRQAFQELVQRHASAEVGISGERIYLRDREMISRMEDLESRLALLRQAAPAFDAAEPSAVARPGS